MDAQHKTCRQCKNDKLLDCFGIAKKGDKRYSLGKCKDCYKEDKRVSNKKEQARRSLDPDLQEKKKAQANRYTQSEKGQLQSKAYKNRPEIKARTKEQQKTSLPRLIRKCIARAAESNLISDIDLKWLLDILSAQNSKCHYCETSLNLTFYERKLNQLSIDRKDNKLGYMKMNCLVTCSFCNLARNCCSYENFVMFISALRSGVIPEALLKVSEKPLGYLCSLRSTTVRPDVNAGKPDIITTDQLKIVMAQQQSKCALTGLTFRNSDMASFPLKPSIDRKDNSCHHTLQNCQLVCLAVNLGKNVNEDDDILAYIDDMKITTH